MLCQNCGDHEIFIIYDNLGNIKQFICKNCHCLIEDALYKEANLNQQPANYQPMLNYVG